MKRLKLTDEQKQANKEARTQARQAAKEAARIEAEKNQKPVKLIKMSIEWKKSRIWGSSPHLSARVWFHDGSYTTATATASGCGYDKESTVIGEIFNQFLKYKLWTLDSERVANWGPNNPAKQPHYPYGIHFNSYEGRPHWYYGQGIGMSCYPEICKAIDGELTHDASGETYDHYTYIDNPPQVKKYRATVKHDAGTIHILTAATSESAAIDIVMQAEQCPRQAIIKIQKI